MRMKHIFDLLHNADDKAISRMAEYPAMDAGRMERLFAASEEKSKHPEAVEEPLTVTESRRPQWTRAALVAACMVICGTTAAGIGALSRMAPPPEEELTAEVTPAATASETVPEVTEPVTSMTAAVPAPAVAATEMQTEAETQPTEGTAAPTEMQTEEMIVPSETAQADSKAAQIVVERQAESVPAAPVSVDVPAVVQDVPLPAETAAAPEEPVQAESPLPGFILEEGQIEPDGTEPECDAMIGDTAWYLRADAYTSAAPSVIETVYQPTYIPEWLPPQQKKVPFQEIRSEDEMLYVTAWADDDGLRILDYVQKPLSKRLEYPDYNGEHVPTFTPASVNGHPAVFVRFWQAIGENVAKYPDVETVWYAKPATHLVWQDGQYLHYLRSVSTLTDEELLSIAESVEPIS